MMTVLLSRAADRCSAAERVHDGADTPSAPNSGEAMAATAWHFGRHWSHLAFILPQRCLPVDAIELVEAEERLWGELLKGCLALDDAVHGRDVLACCVRRVRDDWWDMRSAEEFADTVAACRAQAEQAVADDCAGPRQVAEIYGGIVRRIDTRLREAWLELSATFPMPLRRAAELARHVDSLLRSRNFVDEMIHVEHPSQAPDSSTPNGWERGAQPAPIPKLMIRFVPCHDRPVAAPDGFWQAEFEQRWQSLGDALGTSPAWPRADSPTDWSCRDFVEQIERAFLDRCREVSLFVPERHTPDEIRSSHLGILLAQDRQLVRRQGFSETVELRGQLSFKILQRLVRAGNRYVSDEALADQWEALGGRSIQPSSNQISNAMSELKRAIQPLGLVIPRKRPGVGYRLEELTCEALPTGDRNCFGERPPGTFRDSTRNQSGAVD